MTQPEFSNSHQHEDAALDCLLSQAKWPSADTQAMRRIIEHWENASTAPKLTTFSLRAHRAAVWVLAAAASLGWCTAGALAWRLSNYESRQTNDTWAVSSPKSCLNQPPAIVKKDAKTIVEKGADSQPDQNTPNVHPKSAKLRSHVKTESPSLSHAESEPKASSVQSSNVSGAPPTRFQQMVFVAHQGAAHGDKSAQTAPPQPPEPNPLVTALDQLDENPTIDAENIIKPLAPNREMYERRLLAMLVELRRARPQNSTVEPKAAARQVNVLHLLAHIGGARSVGALMEWMNDPRREIRHAARLALLRIADAKTLAMLAHATTNPTHQSDLLAAVLDRHTPEAMTIYLQCVEEPSLSLAALAAVKKTKSPPIEEFFQRMTSPYQSHRLAAARALGNLDNPSISETLIQLAKHLQFQHEALVGLLSSHDPLAQRFLAFAQSDRSLAAAVYAADMRLR